MSSIPDFDINGVLPPFTGTPVAGEARSPYQVTLTAFVARFATTPTRRGMLRGLLQLRRALRAVKITHGFQWLDGSFLEDVESHEGREPRDLDVVSYVVPPDGLSGVAWDLFVRSRLDLFDRQQTKKSFGCDAFYVSLSPLDNRILVRLTAYWFGLLSHRRDRVWKGFVQVPLDTSDDDQAAWAVLEPSEASR
ncbi:MAG: hypothetical protein Q8Q09_02790 [Deltaproteobacteria bacterium]|nr:hypothetical protein [Deltaproteobacteria bacterium]